ncbi:MAG: DUF1489 domain-containing protein [Pseudomonadota bacterium]
MTEAALHLVKLCVGADGPGDLIAWHKARAARHGPRWTPRHTTRAKPKRAAEVLAGGSLYWVFRGEIRARQRLLAVEPVTGADGVIRHDLVLEPKLVLTVAQARRPFQGWRYLAAADAPADLKRRAAEGGEAELPEDLERALNMLGVS